MSILVLLLSLKVHDVRMMTQCGCVPKIFELSRDLELEHEIFLWGLLDAQGHALTLFEKFPSLEALRVEYLSSQ